MKLFTLPAALALSTALLGAAASAGQIAYSVADNGTTLIKFDVTNPGATTAVGTFAGAATRIDSIDFRPANDLLYGYSQESNSIVTINLFTAGTTFVSTPSTASSTRNLGIDFNPVPDRMRVVNSADQNLRINVTTGATTVDGTLAYAAGDANAGANPNITEASYTNSDTDIGTGTALFYIDSDLDILVSTASPNAGILNTVGALGVNTSDLTGFDILLAGPGNNVFYALLTDPSGIASLYTLNSATGAATAVGVISQSAGSRPRGLAITRVPSPDSWSLALLSAIGLGAAMSRRRARKIANS